MLQLPLVAVVAQQVEVKGVQEVLVAARVGGDVALVEDVVDVGSETKVKKKIVKFSARSASSGSASTVEQDFFLEGSRPGIRAAV